MKKNHKRESFWKQKERIMFLGGDTYTQTSSIGVAGVVVTYNTCIFDADQMEEEYIYTRNW